jgi:hypothetical protein
MRIRAAELPWSAANFHPSRYASVNPDARFATIPPMSKILDQTNVALQANLDRLVDVIAAQCGFDPGHTLAANMRTFFEMEAERLYGAWLQTGDLGASNSTVDRQLGWLLRERAALDAKMMGRAAEIDVPAATQH